MSNLFISRSAPFYRFARPIYLDYINQDEFSQSLFQFSNSRILRVLKRWCNRSLCGRVVTLTIYRWWPNKLCFTKILSKKRILTFWSWFKFPWMCKWIILWKYETKSVVSYRKNMLCLKSQKEMMLYKQLWIHAKSTFRELLVDFEKPYCQKKIMAYINSQTHCFGIGLEKKFWNWNRSARIDY